MKIFSIFILMGLIFSFIFLKGETKSTKMPPPSVTLSNIGGFVKYAVIKKINCNIQLSNNGNQPISMVNFSYQCYLSKDAVIGGQADKIAGGATFSQDNEIIAPGENSTVKNIRFFYTQESDLKNYRYLIIQLLWKNANGQSRIITTASKIYTFTNQGDLELTAVNENVYKITNLGTVKAVINFNTSLQRYKVTGCNSTIPNNTPVGGTTIVAGTEIYPGQFKTFTIPGLIGDNPSQKVKTQLLYYSGPDLNSANNKVCVSY